MVIKVAIVDKDKEYINRLNMALNEFEELSLSVYTEEENFDKIFSSTDFNIVIFNPEIYNKKYKLNKSTMYILLVDDFTKISNDISEYNMIRKYQRASQIYRDLLDCYSIQCADSGEVWNKDKMNIFSVYSPIGGVGKTTIAIVLAEKIAKLGLRTLYINLEDFSSESVYLQQEKGKGISDLFTALEGKQNILLKVKSLVHQNNAGVFYFNHFESPNDLYDLTEDELEELLIHLEKTRYFDTVIIDMNSNITKLNIKVLEMSQKIILVDKANSLEEVKMQKFIEQTHIMNSYGNKMLRIMNFYSGKESEYISDIPIIGKINIIRNSEATELIRSLSNSDAVQIQDALFN